jgi:hypothetical protein
MKFKLLTYSLIAITGLTISCGTDFLIRKKITKELEVKPDEISITKIDSVFLNVKDTIIYNYLYKLDSICRKNNYQDKFSVFTFYQPGFFFKKKYGNYVDSLVNCRANEESFDIDCEYFNIKANEISEINNEINSLDSLVLIELKRLGINNQPYEPKMVDKLNLYFVQKLEDNRCYVFDFDRENKRIEKIINY